MRSRHCCRVPSSDAATSWTRRRTAPAAAAALTVMLEFGFRHLMTQRRLHDEAPVRGPGEAA